MSAKQRNKTLSQYDQHILVTIHSVIYHQVDHFSTLTPHNQICYTTKYDPKTKRYINMTKAREMYEDLYGNPDERWEVNPEHTTLMNRLKRQARKQKLSIGKLREKYVNSLRTD